jgi:hypothetical protein
METTMRKSEIPAIIANSLFDPLVEVRSFGWGRVMACSEEGRLALVVLEAGSPAQTLYEYDDLKEFDEDMRRVLLFPNGSGDGGVGVLAPLRSGPPEISPGFEEPVPQEDPDS